MIMPEIDRELREHQGLSGGAPDARFRAIFERTPIGVAQVCLSTGLILDVNDKLCRIVGCSREGLIGRLMADFVKPEDWVIEQGLLKRMIAGEIDSYELEKRYLRADGTIAWARVTAVKMCDAAGRPLRLSIVEDITARKKAETALQEREERLHAIVETAVDAIITITERGRIDFVNSAATTLFGYTKDEMLGQNVSLLMPQPDRAKHDGYLDHYVQTGRASIIGSGRDVIALHKDGHTFPVHLAVNEVHLPQQRLFTAILHDLSGRRRLEKLVAEASAREQQRIGQDLHDGLGQQLAGLSFFCKSLITRLDAKHSPEAADARRMNELITSALQQARGMARGLNPVSAGGLETALAELAHYISTTFAIPCRFEHDGDIEIEDTDDRNARLPHRPGGRHKCCEARQAVERDDFARGAKRFAGVDHPRRRHGHARCYFHRRKWARNHAGTRGVFKRHAGDSLMRR